MEKKFPIRKIEIIPLIGGRKLRRRQSTGRQSSRERTNDSILEIAPVAFFFVPELKFGTPLLSFHCSALFEIRRLVGEHAKRGSD